MVLPCSTLDLIPQKGKMGFEQTLINDKADHNESLAVIKEDNIFLDRSGRLSNSVLIEYVNQLTAAISGYHTRQLLQEPQKGLFVGLQDAEFLTPVRVGDVLTLHGLVTEKISQVSFVRGIIERNGEKIAELITKLYHILDPAEFKVLTNQNLGISLKNDTLSSRQDYPSYLISNMHKKLFSYIREIHIGDGNITFTIACPRDFDAFDGHFPENPLLPGIALLEIAGVGMEMLTKETLILKSIKKMKINGMVLPDQVITSNIKINENDGRAHEGDFSFTAMIKGTDGKDISRFNGSFQPVGKLAKEAIG